MATIRQQISIILSQKFWPGVGDIDDCWVLSGIMMVFAVFPWLHLPGTKAFRAAAGDPDDTLSDGGSQEEIIRGIRKTWPNVASLFRQHDHASWNELVGDLGQGRHLSIAFDSSLLPPDLQFGFKGYHRANVAMQPGGRIFFGNPLADAYDRWIEIDNVNVIRDAVMAYGKAKTGKDRGAWYIASPTVEQAFGTHPLLAGEVKAGIDTATIALKEENRALRHELTSLATAAGGAVTEAEQMIAAGQAFVAKVKEGQA